MNSERIIQELLERVRAAADSGELERALPDSLLDKLAGSPDALVELAALLQPSPERWADLLEIVFTRTGRRLTQELMPDLVTAESLGRPLSVLEARALEFVRGDRDLQQEYDDLIAMMRADAAGELEAETDGSSWRRLGDEIKSYGKTVVVETFGEQELRVATVERDKPTHREAMEGEAVEVVDEPAKLSIKLEFVPARGGDADLIARWTSDPVEPFELALLDGGGNRRAPRDRGDALVFETLPHEAMLLCITSGQRAWRVPIRVEGQAALVDPRVFLERYPEILNDVLNGLSPADRDTIIEAYDFDDVGFEPTGSRQRTKRAAPPSKRALRARSRFGKALQRRLAEALTDTPEDSELLGPMLEASAGRARLMSSKR